MHPEPNQTRTPRCDRAFDHHDVHAVLEALFDATGPFTRRPREDERSDRLPEHRRGLSF